MQFELRCCKNEQWSRVALCDTRRHAAYLGAAIYDVYGLRLQVWAIGGDSEIPDAKMVDEFPGDGPVRPCGLRMAMAGKRMRNLQKLYFRDRTKEALEDSRRAEAEFDALLKQWDAGGAEPAPQQQPLDLEEERRDSA